MPTQILGHSPDTPQAKRESLDELVVHERSSSNASLRELAGETLA